MPNASPLDWPPGFPRSKRRSDSLFKTGLPAALKNVMDSLRRFGADSGHAVSDIIISSNVSLGVTKPADPGVAVWFIWDGESRCIPVDRYPKVEDNLQAIHHILEARRTEIRHGTLQLVRAAMAGLKALPAPPGKGWREVLKLPADGVVTKEAIETAHRQLAPRRHPDKQGGSNAAMAELNAARDIAIAEVG